MSYRIREIDAQQVKSDAKRSDLTNEQQTRLNLICDWIDGMTYMQLAIKYNIHRFSVSEWIGYYESEGLEGLNRPIKPMKKHTLDATELRKVLLGCGESDKPKIAALVQLAETKNTNETAAKHSVTPQGLLKWKRKYLSGELPLTLIL